jgi:hypothetical protein
VCGTTLQWISEPGSIRLSGEIACLGDIVITVEKALEILDDADDPLVQTLDYSYNAHIRDHRTFLRYDNAHAHPGHSTLNHRHECDWRTEDEAPGSPACLGTDWPTLGEVIEEVGRWRWENYDAIPNPEACPVLGLRTGTGG